MLQRMTAEAGHPAAARDGNTPVPPVRDVVNTAAMDLPQMIT